MSSRLWSTCEALWGAVSSAAAAVSEFAAARKRGCQQRMRRAIGLPPLPEIPARPAAGGEP